MPTNFIENLSLLMMLLLLLLLMLMHPLQCECSCIAGYSLFGTSTCVSDGVSGTFCDGLNDCTSRGHRLLTPSTYMLVKSSLTHSTYVAVTDTLRERYKNKTGWMIVPGNEEFVDVSLWKSSEPSNGNQNQDCVCHISDTGMLHDVACHESHFYRCEYQIDAVTSSSSKSVFLPADIVDFEQPASNCDSPFIESVSLSKCATLCHLRLGCIGLLHNTVRRQCVLLLHLDASVQLPLNSEEEKREWKKMLLDLSKL